MSEERSLNRSLKMFLTKKNGNTAYKNVWDSVKAALRRLLKY